ncbi:hypothetical protein M404DRAFT_511566 [Pisolithus tinctorius Marx 270]|uniref:Uncharacterized protein n=1 Tax=Pisolithus tinctorius Marx 270 TaxID=870435 RepID=A0A0C3PCN9_PISTI|nr:hypothetical protein M404DRAFT_511566 [Pisolithus tinctorius Marx 270]
MFGAENQTEKALEENVAAENLSLRALSFSMTPGSSLYTENIALLSFALKFCDSVTITIHRLVLTRFISNALGFGVGKMTIEGFQDSLSIHVDSVEYKVDIAFASSMMTFLRSSISQSKTECNKTTGIRSL